MEYITESGIPWNGMESGMENIYYHKVEWKYSRMEMEWKVDWK